MPVLVLNPRSDRAFVELVERLVGDCASPKPSEIATSSRPSPKDPRGGRMDADRLLEHLRWWYPHVRIRRRTLGRQPLEAWYVYRDGGWVPDAPGMIEEPE